MAREAAARRRKAKPVSRRVPVLTAELIDERIARRDRDASPPPQPSLWKIREQRRAAREAR